jgi:hypothetical protein
MKLGMVEDYVSTHFVRNIFCMQENTVMVLAQLFYLMFSKEI